MKQLIISLTLLCFAIEGFSQSSQSAKPIISQAVYEKVYLHVDRETYAPRENIWFKIYLVSGINNKLIKGYKNVYVELVNDTGAVSQERLILVHNGVGNGDFKLPNTMEEGQYTIRAYTKYQKNFGEESYFHKKIWIAQMKRQDISRDVITASEIDLGFYPESGSLVQNASNIVAFKAVNNHGLGIPLSGYIVNDLGDTITPFSTWFRGMGKFSLMPIAGRSYYAVLDDYPDFRKQIADVQAMGVTLQFKDEPVDVIFRVIRGFQITGTESFRVTASHKGVEFYSEQVDVTSFFAELKVFKGLFPLGISKITLTDIEGTILAERLVFIQVEEPDVFEIETDRAQYDSREKVDVTIRSMLPAGDSILGGASVSVVNRDYLDREGYSKDIRSYLLLDSELKGKIESPASWFDDEEDLKASEKLDLLMMVHGWRSYYWPEIIREIPEDLKGWEDVGITVSGYVKRVLRKKPIEGAKVTLATYIAETAIQQTLTDESGRFNFKRLYLRDSMMLVVEALTPAGTASTEVIVDKVFIPEKFVDPAAIDSVTPDQPVPGSFYGENFSKQEAERRYAIESGTYWLDEVEIVTQERGSVLNITEESDRTYGTPQKRFMISEEDQSYLNIFDYLEGKLPGVLVEGNNISIRGGQSPTILLDDVVNDLVDISTIPMGDIDHIDIFYSGGQMAAFGSRGADGVIAIYTRMGSINTDFNRFVRGRTTRKVEGFQIPRQFYAPKYMLDEQVDNVPDYRPTLFWEPYLNFSRGEGKIEFYTSDFRSRFLIIVEGISEKGVICTGVGDFVVR